MAEKKDYGKLVKVLQIVTGVLMLIMVGVGIYLKVHYQISLKPDRMEEMSRMISGGAMTIALILIGVMVVKSFCLILPPAVVMGIGAYMLPNYWIALAVNLISMTLSLVIPYFLGRFTGSGMVDTLKKRFKKVEKIEDFAGTNEWKMTAVVKFSGILPGDLSSLLFGAMNISFKNYMFGALLGNLPLIIAYTYFGILLKSEIVKQYPWIAVAYPIVVVVAFILISGVLTKKMISDTSKKAKAEMIEITEESIES